MWVYGISEDNKVELVSTDSVAGYLEEAALHLEVSEPRLARWMFREAHLLRHLLPDWGERNLTTDATGRLIGPKPKETCAI